jgi:hypothetical protein
MSPASVQGGLTNSTGTVRLTTQASGGDAVVALASDSNVVTVPASVTIASGSTSNTFTAVTAAVNDNRTVTITATYLGVAKTTTLALTATPNRAIINIKDGVRGADTCTITSSQGTVDCTFDASESGGTIAKYYWTITVGSSTFAYDTTTASASPAVGCDAWKGGTPVTLDGRPQYVPATVRLQVADSNDRKSDAASKTIRVYPNSECGYGF